MTSEKLSKVFTIAGRILLFAGIQAVRNLGAQENVLFSLLITGRGDVGATSVERC